MRQIFPSMFRSRAARNILPLVIVALASSHAALAQGTGTLTGTVTDGSGGALTGVAIRISSEGIAREATVMRSDGRFVVTDIYAGDYSVEFSMAGFTTVKKTVRIAADRTSILNVRLAAIKKGTKTPPKPEADEEDEDQSWVVPLDTPGGFTTSSPIPDTLQQPPQPPIASLVDDAPEPAHADTTIPPPRQPVPASGDMMPRKPIPANDSTASRTTGEVAGLVIDDGGKPVPGVRLTVNDSKKKMVAKDGTFSLEDLPAGEYDLTLTAKGYRQETRHVTIKPRWVVSLIVRLAAGE